jgi:hypothetical protein
VEEGPELARASHPEVVLFGEPSPVLGDPKPGNGTMPGEPFYLIVIDKDSETFSVEGPMTDDRQWNRAVVVPRKSWRQVTCSTANGSSVEDAARDWLQRYSGKQVPPGEIVQIVRL